MPFAPVNGIDLYYEVHGPALGTAPVIVFAHGAGGNHLSWWQQVPHFRDRYTCVTFDHRGFAFSRDTARPEGWQGLADDLRGLLDALEIEQANLVAQSMGGWSCLGAAWRWPERVLKLVMADTHGGLVAPGIAWPLAERATVPEGVHPACGERMAREQPAAHFLYEQVAGLTVPPRPLRDVSATMNAAPVPSHEDAAKMTLPILFIAGEEDIVIPPPVVAGAAACFPNARLERVPAAGHSVYFERPARVNELVAAFLAE